MKPILRGSLLLLLVIASLAPLANAQGCTMCYTAAAQQSAAGKHALDVGILVLLTPALGIFCGVFYFVWRSREAPGPLAVEEAGGGSAADVWERAGANELAKEDQEVTQSWPNAKY